MHEKYYKIENPVFSLPDKEEDFRALINSSSTKEIVAKAQSSYLPWQEFKNKSWATSDKEKIWALIKLQRQFNAEKTPIFDKDEQQFSFNPRSHIQFLHQVDLEMGGNFMGTSDFSEGDKKKFIRRNLIEESISSSKLEGANTSRTVAEKMLKDGRPPQNKSEQMIVNNHETMKWIEQELRHEDLSLELLLELHKRITHDTIEPGHQGTLRNTFDDKGNRLVIKPWDHQTVAYVTPDREFVEQQLLQFILFANDNDTHGFIHPLMKAIMLHFWLGLLHPFEDGNGRLARILFYWYMLKKGYWAFSYLSLSETIIKSPIQYSMAFIYSEQDGNDLNYFIHYNISKLKLARKKFQDYISRKVAENREIATIIQKGYALNQRQLTVLQYLAKDEQKFTTLNDYHHSYDTIGKVTAAADLKKLVTDGFLQKVRNGRNIYYYPTSKIETLFR